MDGQSAFDGMPQPQEPRVVRTGGTLVFHGPDLLFGFADADVGMRNIVLVALANSRVCTAGRAAELFGVRPELASRLRAAYDRHGPAAGPGVGGPRPGSGRGGG